MLVAGVLIGMGLAGTLDEVLLHQLLGWHHFYDRSTPAVGLASDGLFHLFSTGLLVAGVYRLARRRAAEGPRGSRRAVAGACLGLGGFNLYDGTVQHKVLRLHQIRPQAPDQLPYDVAFVGIALLVLLVGVVLMRTTSTGAGPHTR